MKNEEKVLFEMHGITKIYNMNKSNELRVLNNVELKVNEREFISIVGRSGSGKTTLMNIIGMLDLPTYGEYVFEGKDIFHESRKVLTAIRRKKIGFVFQNFELIPDENALKNVELPMVYAGVSRKRRIEYAKELLSIVGLGDRMMHLPNELSGGQKQRVAIARALANNASLLLADEPTGALDYESGKKITELFHKLNDMGKTVILITHDREIASEAQRIIYINDGCIEKEKKRYDN